MEKFITTKPNRVRNLWATTSLILFVASIVLISAPTNKSLALSSLINTTAQNMASDPTCGASCQSSTQTTTTSSGGSLINQINTAAQNMASDPACGSAGCAPAQTPTPTPTYTYTPTPSVPNLNASCYVSRTRINEGETVRFDANITGGRAPYNVNWSGDTNRISGFNRTSASQTVRINNSGRYFIDLEVTDRDGRRSFDTCPVVIVDEVVTQRDLNVQCDLSRSTINTGDRLDVDAFVSGGTSPYYFTWSRDARTISGFNLTRQNQSIRIYDPGTYRFRIEAEDRYGNKGTDTCTVRVTDGTLAGGVSVRSSSITPPPQGEFAGLSSIYLNQVPYTGPGNILKAVGFILLVLVWSAIVAFYLLKDKRKKDISQKINEFKESNKARMLAN